MKVTATVLAIALLATACGGARPGVGLGAYDRFGPVLAPSDQDIELAADAHVIVLTVQTPNEVTRPILVSVTYPRYDTDRLEFTAGRHRLESRQRTAAAPARCVGTEPTLSGCRPHLPDYPGVQVPASTLTGYYYPAGRIMIASEEALDPFTMAEFFIVRMRTDPDLAAAMRVGESETVQLHLTRVLRERLGPTGWAAYYRPQS
jgi:hypothetical protein